MTFHSWIGHVTTSPPDSYAATVIARTEMCLVGNMIMYHSVMHADLAHHCKRKLFVQKQYFLGRPVCKLLAPKRRIMILVERK
ncbi:hypothetical protein NPIL_650531 [Nephila pilipes]|uniref:Uncharacterized protein n=1 Tax=Nephila pilipes TaxID=299642 RepID=A0A8X6Q3I4_NEPPI|nr:hypothetical protein NPIL_650531 [Nephila pilipes]